MHCPFGLNLLPYRVCLWRGVGWPVPQERLTALQSGGFFLIHELLGAIIMVAGSFEHSLARLEELVQRLERGDLPLEEGLSAFEEGMRLSRRCQDRLDAAEKRVATLTAEEGSVAAPLPDENLR